MDAYPPEWKSIPKQVIGIVNLPRLHSTLTNRLQTINKPLTILLFNEPSQLHEPKVRYKRDYSEHQPEGIWKRDWIVKHQRRVFSALIVLCLLDLSRSLRDEERKIVDMVTRVRNRVEGWHKPKFVLLVLLSDAYPVGSHTFEEFLRNLKALASVRTMFVCEAKSLDSPLALPKFEKVLMDLATQYYKETCTRVRKLKNDVKKEVQPALYTRHRIKVGWYNEVLGQPLKSIKYYRQAYEGLKLLKHQQSSGVMSAMAAIASSGGTDPASAEFELRMNAVEMRPIGGVGLGPDEGGAFPHHDGSSDHGSASGGGGGLDYVHPPDDDFGGGDYYDDETYGGAAGPGSDDSEDDTEEEGETNDSRKPISYASVDTTAEGGGSGPKKLYGDKELHFIGDLINFKICYIRQREARITDALPQFHSHLAWTRQWTSKGFVLPHEYYRNVCKQYRWFGEMLLSHTECNRRVNHENPGFYFQLAATYASLRKKASRTYRESSSYRSAAERVYPRGDLAKPFENDDEVMCKTGYVGKDVYFIGSPEKVAIETHSKNKYMRSIAREVFFEHELSIVELLEKAYESFKASRYVGHRKTLRLILARIADEMFLLERWQKAKDYFVQVKEHYMESRWFDIVSPIILRLLHCSRTLKHSRDWVLDSLLLLSSRLMVPQEQRTRVLEDLNGFFRNPSSVRMPAIQETVDMPEDHLLLDLKMNFDSPFTVVYQEISYNVQFSSTSPLPLKFDRLEVRFNNPDYNIVHAPKGGVILNPGKTVLSFPRKIREKTVIACTETLLHKEDRPQHSLTLRWQQTRNLPQVLANYDKYLEVGSSFVDRPVVRVSEPPSQLKLTFVNKPPMLINELFCVVIVVDPTVEHVINGTIYVNCASGDIEVLSRRLKKVRMFRFGEIQPGQKHRILCYARSAKRAQRELSFTVEYSTTLYPSMVTKFSLRLSARYPLHASYTLVGTRADSSMSSLRPTAIRSVTFDQLIEESTVVNQRTSKKEWTFHCREPFILSTHLTSVTPHRLYLKSAVLMQRIRGSEMFKCLSPKKILIHRNSPSLPASEASVPEEEVMALPCTKKCMSPRDVLSLNHILRPAFLVDRPTKSVPLGSLRLTCRRVQATAREDGERVRDFSFDMPLPEATVLNPALSVHLTHSTTLVVGRAMTLSLTIKNNSEVVEEVQLTIRDVAKNPSFLLCGITEIIFELVPYGERVFKYTLVPLKTGSVTLPKFVVASLTSQLIVVNSELWSVFVHRDVKEALGEVEDE